MNRLKGEFATSQTSHDNRRHELALRTLEIDDLRRALADQASELERAEAERARVDLTSFLVNKSPFDQCCQRSTTVYLQWYDYIPTILVSPYANADASCHYESQHARDSPTVRLLLTVRL